MLSCHIGSNLVISFSLSSSGNYFASHFFMGGEKFDTPHPEGYLFGENMDLNFLGNRPVQVKSHICLNLISGLCLYKTLVVVSNSI